MGEMINEFTDEEVDILLNAITGAWNGDDENPQPTIAPRPPTK